MVQIKSVSAGFPSEEATKILIRPLINSTTDTNCRVYWELKNAEEKTIAFNEIAISDEEYALWDATNESLENIVLTKLNLERA